MLALLLDGLIVAWLLLLAGAVYYAAQFSRGLGGPPAPSALPPAAVIVAVKGASPHLARFLAMLRAQHYAAYRVIAAVESAADPAVPALQAAARGPGAPVTVVVAGEATAQGQKVQNLLRALQDCGAADEVLAFIDADTLPPPDWLPRLVRPLYEGDAEVVTGYRWLVPTDRGLASAAVAAANTSVVTLPRLWHVLWGGTMAMRRSTAERIGLEAALTGAIVDDVHLTRLCRQHRLVIRRPRELLLPSPIRHSWRSAFAFGRRQYLFIRWYFPDLWAIAAVMLTLPVLGGAAALALALRGDGLALAAIATALGLAQLRAHYRARIVRRLWGGTPLAPLFPPLWADRWLPPVWLLLHAACLWGAARADTMWWAGIHYRFRGYNAVEVLSRRRERTDGLSR